MRLRSYWPLVVLFLFWFLVALPFFGPSFIPTHDGEYHIVRFYEFYKVLSDGVIIPRWAPGLNSGYGVPLFNFNYPFPNYVGAAFHFLGVGYIQSFKLALISGYGLALLFCYSLFRKRSSPFLALAVTLIFGTVPYWFVDMNIRGSIGEVWAITWMMAALASITWEKPKVMGAAIGLLIISHNILAMLFVPIIVGYLLIMKKRYFFSLGLGIFAATYFWLPALAEKHFVTGLNSTTFSDHFPSLFQLLIPSWGSGFSAPGFTASEMSQQIGVVVLIMFLLSLFSYFRHNEDREVKHFFLIIVSLTFLLMLELAVPVWRILSPLQFLQYPWRLLSVVLVATPFLATFLMKQWKPWAVGVMCLISILFSVGYIRPVLYQHRDDAEYLNNKTFTDGTNSLGNSFSTIWSDWKRERPLSRIEITEGSATISGFVSTSVSDSFTVNATTPISIRVNRLFFPGWTVKVDTRYISISPYADGIITFSVPTGKHIVLVLFGPTGIRFWSNGISLISVVVLLISAVLRKKYAHRV